MKKRNLYKLVAFVFFVGILWSLEAKVMLASVDKINLSSNSTIGQLLSNSQNNIFSSRNQNFEANDEIVYSLAENSYLNTLTINSKMLDVQLAPSSVLSPVVGPLRVTSSNQGVTGFWEFNQYPGGGLHTTTGGIMRSDDSYAWDVNLYLQGNPNADAGKEVYATADGDVVNYAGVGLPNDCNAVLIAHPSSQSPQWYSGYLHLASYNVSIPQRVTANTVIGRIGRKCVTVNPNDHLHFVIYTKNTSGKLISFNANITERTAGCSIPIGQGASGSELAAFQNAYNNGGAQIALGCPTASVKFDGFTSAIAIFSWVSPHSRSAETN
jgi:murein DD-endopeptidase MepM/ murein hydrolase activator NlpD